MPRYTVTLQGEALKIYVEASNDWDAETKAVELYVDKMQEGNIEPVTLDIEED